MKIVINTCFGGFLLSTKAIYRYAELAGITLYEDVNNDFYTSPDFDEDSFFPIYDIPRNSIELVQTVEELKEAANTSFSELKIIEIPDNIDWYIKEYDGLEHIAEQHRTWR